MTNNQLIYILILFITVFFTACEPAEDRQEISGNADKSLLQYSHKQLGLFSRTDSTNGSLLVLTQTSKNPVTWGVFGAASGLLVYTSFKQTDTIKLDFTGNYTVRVVGVFGEGQAVDSFTIQSAIGDPSAFVNPMWGLLTNKSAGKYWKMTAKYVGPEYPFSEPPAWFQPDITKETWFNDSVYFDLNAGFNYKHYSAGKVIKSGFTLSLKDSLLSFKAVGVGMPNNDNGEMAVANVFRIRKLTRDTLVVGQGATMTASRQTENWSWYWLFVRK